MKVFTTIPTSKEAKLFFNRYAGAIRNLKKMRTPVQIISAITEFTVFYAIGYKAIEPLNTEIAHYAGIFSGVVLTIAIELGIRYSVGRSIAEWLDRSGNTTLRFILSFVAIAVLFSSGFSSFEGSKDIASAMAKEPALQTTFEQDSINQAIQSDLQRTFSIDSANIIQRYKSQQAAQELAFDAKISAAKREKRNYQKEAGRTGNSFASKIDQARLKIETLEAEKATTIAAIQSDLNGELSELEKTFKADQKSQQAEYKTGIAAIETGNQNLIDESEANIKATGKGFGWITIVCLLFYILVTWADEILKLHSDIKEVVLPGEFANRENSWVEIWKGFAAKAERWRRKVAAKLTDHSHTDIDLPYKTVYQVDGNYDLLKEIFELVEEQKRAIGFHKEKETKEEFVEVEILNKNHKKTTNHESNFVDYKVPTKKIDDSLELWQLKQKLKKYKKNIGKFKRQISTLENKNEKVPQRKINALRNNQAWEASLIKKINELEGNNS